MRLDGTLDAFSLPDILHLLTYTKKTGALHLRRESPAGHGVVFVTDGAVTGGSAEVSRQGLARRLVAVGDVGEEALAAAVRRVAAEPGLGVTRALLDAAAVDPDVVEALAVEHATDAVSELMRWADGEYSFFVDEANPEDVGASRPLDDIVAEGRGRLGAWAPLAEVIPSPQTVLTVALNLTGEPVLTRDEWALLALVDGRRTVRDLVSLTGRGDYPVVSALAGMVGRGLLEVTGDDDGVRALERRQGMLAALEIDPTVAEIPVPGLHRHSGAPGSAGANRPAGPVGPTVPARAEPLRTRRTPAFAEDPQPPDRPRPWVAASSAPAPAADHDADNAAGRAAQPATAPPRQGLIERDPALNRSLLLRLIAAVQGM